MKSPGTQTIETKRLILRRFTMEDAQKMHQGWVTDQKVTRFLSWDVHKDLDQTINLLKRWIGDYEEGSYNWVVELKETGELIGNISAIRVNQRHHNCEIGYCYGSPYWNHGYASEALKAVIDYMLDECEMHVVEARHDSRNPASGAVMRKSGMIKEAVMKDRRYEEETGTYSDLVWYYAMRE